MNSNQNSQKTLTASDNLDLARVSVPEIPNDIVFPDELNRYLRDQIQYLTHENGMLYKNLSEAETQIKRSESKISILNSHLEEYKNACPKNSLTGCTANLASSRIVELSKKLRERNAEMEVYKTRCSKLEQHIFELENREKNNRKEDVLAPPLEKPKNELEEQLKTLQDKLNTTNAKLYEVKNSNVQLKNDLKMANKMLQQEVGENIDSFQSWIHCNPNWRGRAQIICDLQQKNGELREKLRMYQEKDKGLSITDIPTPMSKQDKRLENLTKENEQLRNVVHERKRKIDAARARNKVLESESSIFRAKISAMIDQSDEDSQLITSLKAKVSNAQLLQNEAVHQKVAIIQKLERENKMLQMQVEKSIFKIDNCTAQVEEQQREIENLRDKIKKQNPFSPPKTVAVDTKTINQLETERLRLLELTKLANERLESERSAHAILQSKFRIERQKAAKLESKVARLELDQQLDRTSTYSILSLKSKDSDTTLEDQLQLAQETVKALEMRLEMEREEHRNDIEEFTKILKNYNYVQRNEFS